MNLAKRSLYFFIGASIGIVIVVFIAKQKKINFPYGFDARTLKSIRVKKEYIFSDQAQKMVTEHHLDSIRIAYLLSESDVDFSESDTDTSKPCQTYTLNGSVDEKDFTLIVKRCDSSATFEKIVLQNK